LRQVDDALVDRDEIMVQWPTVWDILSHDRPSQRAAVVVAIMRAVDRSRRPSRFVLAGSVNIARRARIA
jgi:hypothetical protein